MYIIIQAYGHIYRSETISHNDKLLADKGVLDILRLSDLKQYYHGDWYDTPEWKKKPTIDPITNNTTLEDSF
ncbi:MAG TPA: hypothetical protein VN922_23840 [Bacteroidia bacterium]|nr:hypothetical protein [Bacteroidia bacterium]